MSYIEIAQKIVDSLNAKCTPQNSLDKYKLEDWNTGFQHMAVIYRHGGKCTNKGFGIIAHTHSNDNHENFEDACAGMLRHFYKIDFDSPEELELKLAILGY